MSATVMSGAKDAPAGDEYQGEGQMSDYGYVYTTRMATTELMRDFIPL